ncbi:MAG: ComEC/Rec2 family competence protein, partial [Bacilli bacterium]|nr:ComEC/Rec2 family competence protein [Bacilli bacterium]
SYLNKEVFTKKRSYIELLSIQLFFFLIVDSTLIYQQAFYLGFLISFVLIYIRTYSKKVNNKIKPLIIVLAITFLMLPISLGNTNELHLFTPIFQLLLMPIHIGYVVLSLISFYIYPFKYILNGITKGILIFYKDLSYIDLSVPIGKISTVFIVIYYISLALSLFYFESKRWKHMYITLGVLATVIVGSVIPVKTILTNGVYFINVGQGDSILIRNRTHAVMIDTGGNKTFDMAVKTLIPFLKKNHVYKLDALITSHDDFDHSGAKESLMKNYKVGEYINSQNKFPYTVGDITLTNINTYQTMDDNDSSLVLTLNFMNRKWLFTGDASTTVEKFLIDKNIDIDCDVLKVGHHGSKTSTCDEFLKATTPDIAIISVGANNYYGHPNDEVINRLRRRNIEIRRTDLEGTISFVEFA